MISNAKQLDLHTPKAPHPHNGIHGTWWQKNSTQGYIHPMIHIIEFMDLWDKRLNSALRVEVVRNGRFLEDAGRTHTCGKLKAVLLSPIIANESRIWLTWWCKLSVSIFNSKLVIFLLIIGTWIPEEKIPYQYFCLLQVKNRQIAYHQKFCFKKQGMNLISVIAASNVTDYQNWGLVEELHLPFLAPISLLQAIKENISIQWKY